MKPTEQLLRDALERIKLNAVSLADAQVIALEALAAPRPAQPHARERLAQLEQWIDATGAIVKNSSWHGELQAIVAGTGEPAQQEAAWTLPHAFGVARDAKSPGQCSVSVAFMRKLTDDELCILHDALAGRASLPSPAPQAAVPSERKQTDLSKRLREYDDPRLYREADVLMSQAADEIERYYGGMLAWKATAEAKDADFARALSRTAPVVAEGWKLVPIQPTLDMIKAAQFHTEHDDDEERGDPKNYRARGQAAAVWHDMLAASPSAAQGEGT